MKRKDCLECQGDKVSPRCIPLDKHGTLEDFVDETSKSLKELEKEPDFILGELSPIMKKWTRDEVIQLLIDEVIRLRQQIPSSTSSKFCDSIDWSPIQDCSDCPKSECDNLQTLINKSGELFEREGI